MKKLLLCSLIVICLAAIQFLAKAADADEIEEGKEIYTNKCQMCHGVDAKGDGPAASAFNPLLHEIGVYCESQCHDKHADAKTEGAFLSRAIVSQGIPRRSSIPKAGPMLPRVGTGTTGRESIKPMRSNERAWGLLRNCEARR